MPVALKKSLPLIFVAALGAACDDDSLGRLKGVLEAQPLIDFGDVQVGIQSDYTLEVRNTGQGVVMVTAIERGENFNTPEYEFKVPGEKIAVAPTNSEKFTVSFQPFAETELPVESSFRLVTDADNPNEAGTKLVVTVQVRGRGVRSGLLVEPNPIDFGTVLSGSSRTMDVKITNLLAVPVDLTTKQRANGTAEVETVAGTGKFDIVSMLGPNGSLVADGSKLMPMDSVTIQARYAPDAIVTGMTDRGRWTISNCSFSLCDVSIPMLGNSTNAGLMCEPSAIDYGAVNPGVTLTRQVTCRNISTDALTLEGWRIETGSGPEFTATPFAGVSSTLAPNDMFTVDVMFAPTLATLNNGMSATGTLIVQALNPRNVMLDPVRISLTGTAGGPTIDVFPPVLHFGQVAIGTSSTKRLIVANNGYSELVVTNVNPDGANTGVFFTNTPAFNLAVGDSITIEITFTPLAETQYNSGIIFSNNDTGNPELGVLVDGTGLALGPCAYRITPSNVTFGAVPQTETRTRNVRVENIGSDPCLMNDIELLLATPTSTTAFRLINGNETGLTVAPGTFKDIPVEYAPITAGGDRGLLGFYISSPTAPNPTVELSGVGEPLTQVTCPAPVTTPAGTAVTLVAMGIARGTMIANYDWQIIGAPMGGIGTPGQWTPDPPQSDTETFLPYIVGTYTIHVTVFDTMGGSAFCDTQVIAEGHGLRVTMTWDGNGDIDLHLHNNAPGIPWFNSPNDCYYGNRTPIWDAAQPASTGPNPELDFDNTFALGPENTTIDDAIVGQTYTIGAHNFSSGSGRIVTIQVFCGQGIAPVATFVSSPMAGSTAGNCTANDFWKVANVVFTTPTACTVTPINTVVASSAACTAF